MEEIAIYHAAKNLIDNLLRLGFSLIIFSLITGCGQQKMNPNPVLNEQKTHNTASEVAQPSNNFSKDTVSLTNDSTTATINQNNNVENKSAIVKKKVSQSPEKK